MLKEYTLIYYRRSDDKRFLARRTANNSYMFYDEETGEKFPMSSWFIRKDFKKDKSNKYSPKRRKFKIKNDLPEMDSVG